MSNIEPARPVFRRLATVMAVVCYIIAALFGLFLKDGKLFFVAIALFVGFVMSTIALTGYWPPRKSDGI